MTAAGYYDELMVSVIFRLDVVPKVQAALTTVEALGVGRAGLVQVGIREYIQVSDEIGYVTQRKLFADRVGSDLCRVSNQTFYAVAVVVVSGAIRTVRIRAEGA